MTEANGEPHRPSSETSALKRTRLLTRASVSFERFWPLFLPFLGVLAICLAFAWLGLLRSLPDGWRLGVSLAGCLALVAALYPLRFFRMPRAGEIDRRIESANGLRHSPVLVQQDKPVAAGAEDEFAAALWREHQKRMAARLADLSSDRPRTRVPERDPWGLRAIAVLLLVTAFAFSFGPLGGSLADGLRAAAPVEPVPPRIDAWVTPPAYTGVAPIFLSDATGSNGPIRVPEGSEVALRITGGSGSETLVATDANGSSNVKPEEKAADASLNGTSPLPADVQKPIFVYYL